MLRPQQGAEAGQRVCIGEEEDIPPEAAKQTCTQGGCAFPTKTLALEGHDVTQDVHDVIQHLMDFGRQLWHVWLVPEAQGGLAFCSKRPMFPYKGLTSP
jgi:hypothetical protein